MSSVGFNAFRFFCILTTIIMTEVSDAQYNDILEYRSDLFAPSQILHKSSTSLAIYFRKTSSMDYYTVQMDEATALCSIGNFTSVSSVYSSWKCANLSVHEDICNWDNVLCSNKTNRHVLGISLSGLGITGILPSAIGLLRGLTSLRLGKNMLHGSLPTSISLLSNLQDLRINSNYFSGPIPSELGFLTKLQSFYFSYNGFNGAIPPSIGNLTNLNGLHLSYNTLSGVLPTSLGFLTSLQSIRLASNRISGTIASSFGLLPLLSYLDLSENHLSGAIPLAIGSLENIEVLRLSNNLLSGSIPSTLWTNENLREVYLDNNQLQHAGFESLQTVNTTNLQTLYINNNNFHSSIPINIATLSSLVILHMGHNNLFGNIPSSIGRLNQLTGLYLSYNSITGVIPTSIGSLSQLEYLYLGHDHLTGNIPTEIGHLSQLVELRLWGNLLTGSIPTEIGSLTQLVGLRLYGNKLTGTMPTQLGNLSRLRVLRLFDNLITGTIPTELGYLFQLTFLDLYTNTLKGPIPSTLGHLFLKIIDLSGNVLRGPIPTDLGYLFTLEKLVLNSNMLTGPIPTELRNLSKLVDLELSSNMLTGPISKELCYFSQLQRFMSIGNALTGTIPSDIRHLANLDVLYLSANKLTGSIPSELGFLSLLSYIDLSQNLLSGPIPTELAYLTEITSLVLSAQYLVGPIPTGLGYLSKLRNINLGGNSLTGPIPTLFSNLTLLEIFILNSNSLTSSIPSAIADLSWLVYLDLSDNSLSGSLPSTNWRIFSITYLSLSHNRFTGRIPSSIKSLTSALQFDLSHNLLTGPIPSQICELTSLTSVYLDSNSLSGSLPSCIGTITNLLDLQIQNNKISGTVSTSFCTIHFTIFYMSNTSITSYPSCLRADLVDFLDSIPHDFGPMDLGLCGLADSVQRSQALARLVIDQSPVVLESEHPWSLLSNTTSEVFTTFIADDNAFQYQIVFDVLSQTSGPIKFCGDSSCSHIFAAYSGEKGFFPGTARIPPLIISRASFYLSISSTLFRDTSPSWGYKITIRPSSRGSGWLCSDIPTTPLFTRSLRASSSSRQPYALNPCSWTGVDCHGLVNVTAVSMTTFGITGTIPSTLKYLTFLTSLDLSYNQFRGTLPSAIGYLRNLQSLDLANNRLSGTLPSTLLFLTQLSSLTLSQNLISGSIPSFIANMTYLSKFDIKSNIFSGKVSESICPLVQSSKNTTVILWNNPKLTCYENCWRRKASSVFDGEISACAPTSVPTTQPTSPTSVPTSPVVSDGYSPILSSGGVAGVIVTSLVIFTVILIILFKIIREYRKRHHPDARLIALESLPLHRAAYEGAELSEVLIREYLHSAFLRDFDGKTVIDIIFKRGKDCRITAENLYVLVEVSLSDFIETSNLGSQSNDVWTQLIQMDDDRSLKVIRTILGRFKPHIKLLAHGKDRQGRSYLDLASPKSKNLIRCQLYLYERYELNSSFEHMSPTCQVWLAIYHSNPSNNTLFQNLGVDSQVALKFMRNREQLICELNSRLEGNLSNRFVVGIKKNYDGDSDDPDCMAFRADAISKGFIEYPYCIVLEGAGQSLANIMLNNNVADIDMDRIKIIMKHVLCALQHMHERGIVHGDIKPSNIVVCGRIFKLIDLDGAANMNRGDYVGANYSSLYCPPEMFWENEEGILGVRSFSRDCSSSLPATGVFPYELVKAEPSHDIWAVGALLYYLVTGNTIVLADAQDNIVEQKDMKLIYDWDDDVKYQKILDLSYNPSSTTIGNFLSLLLYKDPKKRMSATQALEHPFLSGMSLGRTPGVEIEYDIFLSYRLDKDGRIADKLYELLAGLGLRVFRVVFSGEYRDFEVLGGLAKSACFVCLLSRGTIHSTILEFHTDSVENIECKNVMLEWLLALELSTRGYLQNIYPVVIGDNDGDDNYSDYFVSGCHPSDVSDVSEATLLELHNRFRRQLEEQSLGSPFRRQEHNTITDILKDIMINQGFLFTGKFDDGVRELADKIKGMTDNSKCRSSRRVFG